MPVGIPNLLSLFQYFVSLALKSPKGERSIKYSFIHSFSFIHFHSFSFIHSSRGNHPSSALNKYFR